MDWTNCSQGNCEDTEEICQCNDISLKPNRQGIFSNFDEMRRNAVMTDVILKCDETEFPVHKSFLASSSEYFHAMFTCGFQETTDNIIEFKNIDAKSMHTVLRFLYLDCLEFDQEFESVCNLLDALHFFLLYSAYTDCRSNLISLLSETTYRTIWDMGFKYDDREILKAVELFICRKAADIHQTKDIVNLNVCQITRVIECFMNMISYHSDELIDIIFKWIEFDQSHRVIHLQDFLSKINLTKLSSELIELLINHPLINENRELLDLISSVSLLTPGSYSNINETLRLQVVVLGKNEGQQICDMFVYSLHWGEWNNIKLPLVEFEVNKPCCSDDNPFCGSSDAVYDARHSRLVVVSRNSSNCIIDINECLLYPEDSPSNIKITRLKQNNYDNCRILFESGKVYVAGILELDGSVSSDSDGFMAEQLIDSQIIFKEMDLDHCCPLWKTITRIEDGGFSQKSMVISFIKNGMEVWLIMIDWGEANRPLLHCFKVHLDSSDEAWSQSKDNEEMYFNIEIPFDFFDTELLIKTISTQIIFKKSDGGGYVFDLSEKRFSDMLPMENEPRNIVSLTSWKETLWALDTSNQIHVCDLKTRNWEKICQVPATEEFIAHKFLVAET